MSNKGGIHNYDPGRPTDLPERVKHPRTLKKSCLLPVIGLASVVLCVVAAVVGYLLFYKPPSLPSVMIDSPRNAERVGVGKEVIIHAIARGEQKIKRVELWVDGKLQDAQSTSVPGAISPFPLVVSWRAPTPGAHTLLVRAYNTQNARGHASINVEAISSADRDNDGVPDATDPCPDQLGALGSNGCPAPSADDRDGDGILDSADACPDQSGALMAQGCPDADGDMVRDSVDACPREFGVPERNGCPAPGDADGDNILDSADECPSERGPASTRGCPDRDGDSVRDRDDACPDVAGAPGQTGCPDRDSDGVRDAQDVCPDAAGPASNSGCPPTGTGDRDGDGVDNGTDLAPDEPGSADNGGAPPPGGGADRDGDGVADDQQAPSDPFRGLIPVPMYSLTFVEFQALEFSTYFDFDRIYCYAGLAGNVNRYGPFDPLTEHRWDIAEYLGGQNSRRVGLRSGQPLEVRAECYGERRSPFGGGFLPRPFALGSFTIQHAESDWHSNPIRTRSSITPDGYYFFVNYRICRNSCTPMALQPPEIGLRALYVPPPDKYFLDWMWSGDWASLKEFRIYRNGNRLWTVNRTARSAEITSHKPPCGQTDEYYMTSVHVQGDRESPPSGTVRWTPGETFGERSACMHTVSVTFETLDTHLRGPGAPGPDPAVGPIRGSLWVNDQRVDYDTDHKVQPDHTYQVASLLTRNNVFTVELDESDDLTVGGTVIDRDRVGRDDTLFSAQHTFRAGETLPARYELTNRLMKLIVRIQVVSNP